MMRNTNNTNTGAETMQTSFLDSIQQHPETATITFEALARFLEYVDCRPMTKTVDLNDALGKRGVGYLNNLVVAFNRLAAN